MSLLENAYEDYVLLNKVRVDDGLGGYVTTWTDGVTIKGAMVIKSAVDIMAAQSRNSKATFTLTTKKNITLEYHDVLRRVRDDKIFRVTSDGDDKFTPESAGLDMRQVDCEEWALTED